MSMVLRDIPKLMDEEVLGLCSLDGINLRDYISEIICHKEQNITFVLTDGDEITVAWSNSSRRNSWTEEMKQAARQKNFRKEWPMSTVKRVTVLEPISSQVVYDNTTEAPKLKVAAYARVSTEQDEQQSSYEAQVNYYNQYIRNNPAWEFVGIYADEGITGTNTKKRDGFNRMIADAKAGKIDLILTKSISRFARNTVDALQTIRELSALKIEVYFEKEGIHTLDKQCEVMLTIMSSLAQEESRSISENVRWGKQKSMQDGNVSFGYRHFLGYRKGKDGRPEVVPEEAAIVRDIYRMFLDGMTIRNIAKELTERGIKTPGGKDVWSVSTIRSILSNEKYKGDALLQKTYTLDYLSKTVKKNNGEVKQYYVTNSHEAIIDEDVFNLVQAELQRRSKMRRGLRNSSPFCTKLVCGDCGSFYGHKIYHAKEKHSKDVWYCNRRYQGSNNCSTPILSEDDLVKYYLQALSEILADKDKYISACRTQMDEADTLEKMRSKREKAEAALAKDMAKIQALVRENAYISQDQQVYRQRFEEMSKQIEQQKNNIAELQEQELRLVGVREKLSRFIEALESFNEEPTFDSATWNSLVERVLVNPRNLIFEFKNGEKIKISI